MAGGESVLGGARPTRTGRGRFRRNAGTPTRFLARGGRRRRCGAGGGGVLAPGGRRRRRCERQGGGGRSSAAFRVRVLEEQESRGPGGERERGRCDVGFTCPRRGGPASRRRTAAWRTGRPLWRQGRRYICG